MNKQIKNVLNRLQKGECLTIWFDIDGTLADTNETDYTNATPVPAMVSVMNYLYDKGCNIFVMTARGATSGVNWREITERQLASWGAKYHKLIMGYPRDLYIGDEAMRPEELLEILP